MLRQPGSDFHNRRGGRFRASSARANRLRAATSRLEIDSTIRAAAFAEPTLRSLDAIHLATAQVLTNEPGTTLTAFVTYDRRLRECAREAGLPVASPGQT